MLKVSANLGWNQDPSQKLSCFCLLGGKQRDRNQKKTEKKNRETKRGVLSNFLGKPQGALDLPVQGRLSLHAGAQVHLQQPRLQVVVHQDIEAVELEAVLPAASRIESKEFEELSASAAAFGQAAVHVVRRFLLRQPPPNEQGDQPSVHVNQVFEGGMFR